MDANAEKNGTEKETCRTISTTLFLVKNSLYKCISFFSHNSDACYNTGLSGFSWSVEMFSASRRQIFIIKLILTVIY